MVGRVTKLVVRRPAVAGMMPLVMLNPVGQVEEVVVDIQSHLDLENMAAGRKTVVGS